MIIEIVKAMNFWLNAFPVKSGISKVLSPRTIVTGRAIDYKMNFKIECGRYL